MGEVTKAAVGVKQFSLNPITQIGMRAAGAEYCLKRNNILLGGPKREWLLKLEVTHIASFRDIPSLQLDSFARCCWAVVLVMAGYCPSFAR